MPERITQLFAQHDLRCTAHRRAIYTALMQTDTHPTVDELYQRLGGGMSLATVYNTLECLCDAGLARKIAAQGENGSARYDADTDNHLHLRDRNTGRIADVPPDIGAHILKNLPQDQLANIEKNLGFKIKDVQIEFVGEFE